MRFAHSLIELLKRDYSFDKTQYAADAVAFMNALAVAFLVLTIVEESRGDPGRQRWARALLATVCLVYLGFCMYRVDAYTRSIGLYDHVEASTLAVSWLWAGRGEPLYHGTDAAARYSIQYGPMLFVVDGLALRLIGPSVFSAKLAGAALWAASVVLLFATLKKEVTTLRALVATMYGQLCLMLASGGIACFNLRAEPHLVFWACAGLFAAGMRSPSWAVIGCGAAAGVSIDLKVHGALYLLPAFAILGRRHGARAVPLAVAIACLVALVPFVLLPRISLPFYVRRLAGAAQHGLAIESAKAILAEGAFVAMPVVGMLASFALGDRAAYRDFLRSNRTLLAILILAFLLVAVPGSKEGAGSHHLLPLYPALALVLGQALAQPVSSGGWRGRFGRAVALAFVPMALLTTISLQCETLAWERHADVDAREILAEVEGVESGNPDRGVAIGYGDDTSYYQGILRCLPALQGQPYLLDSASLMDHQQEGVGISKATREAVWNGAVPIWLIPYGNKPFSAHSFYRPYEFLFDEAFRRAFQEHYSLRGRTKHFDIWVYVENHPSPRAGKTPGRGD